MLLEYSYDKANTVLNYFKNSELATLDIRTIKGEKDDEPKFVMEYTLIKDYSEPKQNLIRKILSDSLPERLRLTDILNQFIENQILKNVNEFSLKFNAVNVRKCEIVYSYSYKQSSKNRDLIKELTECLEQYDSIVTEMGIADQTVANVYRREGSGRNKKNIPLTIKEIGNILRQSLSEE